MNLIEIRNLAQRQDGDPVVIERECLRALALRPETLTEHAELLYLYAEAYSALHQQEASLVFEYAQRAREHAKKAGAHSVALQAGLLALRSRASAKLCTKEVFFRSLDSLQQERDAAASQANLDAYQSASLQGRLRGLELFGASLEQNDGFAAA
jgi:hypothetical protein